MLKRATISFKSLSCQRKHHFYQLIIFQTHPLTSGPNSFPWIKHMEILFDMGEGEIRYQDLYRVEMCEKSLSFSVREVHYILTTKLQNGMYYVQQG